jgi:hypothetical protein
MSIVSQAGFCQDQPLGATSLVPDLNFETQPVHAADLRWVGLGCLVIFGRCSAHRQK